MRTESEGTGEENWEAQYWEKVKKWAEEFRKQAKEYEKEPRLSPDEIYDEAYTELIKLERAIL